MEWISQWLLLSKYCKFHYRSFRCSCIGIWWGYNGTVASIQLWRLESGWRHIPIYICLWNETGSRCRWKSGCFADLGIHQQRRFQIGAVWFNWCAKYRSRIDSNPWDKESYLPCSEFHAGCGTKCCTAGWRFGILCSRRLHPVCCKNYS